MAPFVAGSETTSSAAIAERAFAAINERTFHDATWWDAGTVYTFVGSRVCKGREQIVAYFEELVSAFPDFAIEVERVVSDGPVTAVSWNGYGTFRGTAFLGIAPTGRRISFRGVDVVTTSNNVISTNIVYLDGLSFARQVGMLPPDGTRTDRLLKACFNALTSVRRARSRRTVLPR